MFFTLRNGTGTSESSSPSTDYFCSQGTYIRRHLVAANPRLWSDVVSATTSTLDRGSAEPALIPGFRKLPESVESLRRDEGESPKGNLPVVNRKLEATARRRALEAWTWSGPRFVYIPLCDPLSRKGILAWIFAPPVSNGRVVMEICLSPLRPVALTLPCQGHLSPSPRCRLDPSLIP